MNQRIFCLLVGVISAGHITLAQGDTSQVAKEQAAFVMTKATVEFLATDAKTFGYNKTPCQPCATYDDLNRFIKENNLSKADQLVTDVRRMAPSTTPADLRAFLLKRVTEGADRTHRQKLASFANYQRALNAAIGDVPAASAMTAPTDDNDLSGTDQDIAAEDTSSTDQPGETTLTNLPSSTQSLMSSWLPLVLSLLSLAGVVILFFRRSQSQPQSVSSVDKSVTDEMSKRISKLEISNKGLIEQMALLREAARQPSGSVAPTQNEARPPSPTLIPKPASDSVVPPMASTAQTSKVEPVAPVRSNPPANTLRPPQPTTPTLLYGRTADLGDGFSVSGLSAKSDRDTVFEILQLDANRAEFQVSDNPDLQRLALSDPYSYLNDTCSYATQPRPGSRIRTERPGALSLQGEKWVITEKAQISFTG